DVRQAAVLGDVELDQQLALDAALTGRARIDPVGLDAVAHLIEVVLVLRLRRVERDRLAVDPAAPTALEPAAPARLPPDAGGRARDRDLRLARRRRSRRLARGRPGLGSPRLGGLH